jgi:tRNA 2-thiouridine synthesizing protein A
VEGVARPESEAPARPPVDLEWDAGDMSCGELVFELRARLGSVRPGGILKLTARDPGAPADLPAWCRLTGHTLVHSAHPDYWIRRKGG